MSLKLKLRNKAVSLISFGVAFASIIGTSAVLLTSQIASADMAEGTDKQDGLFMASSPNAQGYEVATIAGGCFWCIEAPFDKLDGVVSAVSGYAGGESLNPTYKQVSSGRSGHLEVVQVTYDPQVLSYNDILKVFWKQFDPTDANGSFVDRGKHYSSAVFYHNLEQKKLANAWIQALNNSDIFDNEVITPVRPLIQFYAAEDYHQNYHKTNPQRYKYYRRNSGRDSFLDKTWGKDRSKALPVPSLSMTDHSDTQLAMYQAAPYKNFVKPDDKVLKQTLTPIQYKVTQKDSTERPFDNLYWDNKAKGIYVDVVSGEPLFSSKDKFKSGTGWPSFFKVIDGGEMLEKEDNTLWSKRTELRSVIGDSHLGHVFNDGPQPTGLRYCINSASLNFIALEDMESKGYGDFIDAVK